MQCSVSDRWETGPPIEKFRSLAKLSCVIEIVGDLGQIRNNLGHRFGPKNSRIWAKFDALAIVDLLLTCPHKK